MFWLGILSDLGQSVHETTNEANKDGRYTAESDRCVEEDESTEGDRKLVQGADH